MNSTKLFRLPNINIAWKSPIKSRPGRLCDECGKNEVNIAGYRNLLVVHAVCTPCVRKRPIIHYALPRRERRVLARAADKLARKAAKR